MFSVFVEFFFDFFFVIRIFFKFSFIKKIRYFCFIFLVVFYGFLFIIYMFLIIEYKRMLLIEEIVISLLGFISKKNYIFVVKVLYVKYLVC